MSYYVLGVLIAYVYFLPGQEGRYRAVTILVTAMTWPITVPLVPFFWLYSCLSRPRPERDLIKAVEQYKRALKQGKI